MKYQGKELWDKECGITQVCVIMALLAGSFLTLVVIGFSMMAIALF
jgi:hypothetical protein